MIATKLLLRFQLFSVISEFLLPVANFSCRGFLIKVITDAFLLRFQFSRLGPNSLFGLGHLDLHPGLLFLIQWLGDIPFRRWIQNQVGSRGISVLCLLLLQLLFPHHHALFLAPLIILLLIAHCHLWGRNILEEILFGGDDWRMIE